MKKSLILIAITMAFPGPLQASPDANEVRACVAKKRAEHADSKPFSITDEVRCDQAQIFTSVTKPIPKCESRSASKPLTYEAPKGRQIVGDINLNAVSTLKGGGVSAITKSYDSDGNVISASASLTCKSPAICPGGPGSASKYEMSGFTENVANEENFIAWTIECSKLK